MSIRPSPARIWVWAVLPLAALAAASCSSSDSDDRATTDSTAPPDTGVVEEEVASAKEPVPGGDVVYAFTNETDGWNPTTNAWAPEGVQVALTVYDPLTAYDIDGVARPYLAESIEPNDDFTEWTITLREGIEFHNGDPLTADAVKTVLEGHRDSPLSGPAVAPIEGVEVVDDVTASVTMNTPWVAFPQTLTAQMGVVPHPTILVEEINDAPIGTGPFVFDEWVPDKDFRAVRYDGYWREGLPYLDSIEYRPINEPQTRRASFDSGDVDVMATAAARDSQDFEEQAEAGDDVQFYADRGENEENFVMLNLAAPPFDDVRVREALAYATDAEAYNNVVNQGAYRLARGPFVPESPYYIPSCTEAAEGEDCVDQPTFDPDKARELLAELEAERGGPIAFTLGNTPNEVDRDQSALLQEMWQDVGFEVELSFTDQGQYIFDTLAGDYQAVVWRQFGQPDPDSDSQWWYSDSGLNFANIVDQEVDDALDRGRSLPDEADRVDAYADLQRRFAELLPYLWTYHTEWAIVAQPHVQDLPSGPLPDGSESMPFVTGTHRVGQMWIDPDLQ